LRNPEKIGFIKTYIYLSVRGIILETKP